MDAIHTFGRRGLVPVGCARGRPARDLLALRRQILAGTYVTDAKLEIVVERLVKVLTDGPRRTAAGCG